MSSFGESDEALDDEARPRDTKIDDAKKELRAFFQTYSGSVFYHRQLCVLFERRFFHWITGRALKELAEDGSIGMASVPIAGIEDRPLQVFHARRHRYWRRQAVELANLVSRFSISDFGRALGNHGEMMVDAAFSAKGFTVERKQVREFNEKRWQKTQHDLDRIYQRDECHYGCEIKNTLDYIPREELELKLELCFELGLIPLFVVRMAPATYIEVVNRAGGYTLVLEYQLYPHGFGSFAQEVRTALGVKGEMVRADGKKVPFRFPVDSPAALADGTVQRFLSWHLARVMRVNRKENSPKPSGN